MNSLKLFLKELVNNFINRDCKFYPCHNIMDNCFFCYCPYFPCNIRHSRITNFGGFKLQNGNFDCSYCYLIHSNKFIIPLLLKNISNIKQYVKNKFKKNKNIIIGLVGNSGCGKSTAAHIFYERYNFEIISLDSIGHIILNNSKEELIKHFGNNVLKPDGEIDRNYIANIVFNSYSELHFLNNLTHPQINKYVLNIISREKNKNFIIEGALLYEIKLHSVCDYIIRIESPLDLNKERLLKKNIPENKIDSIQKSQKDLKFNYYIQDFVIFNNEDINKLLFYIDFFMKSIL